MEILYIADAYLNDKYLKTNTMLPDQKQAFDAFYHSARHSGVIDNKISLRIHLASEMAVG
jgi:predicted SnoaL-like aldol condensation-catalyzing enzyme